MSPKIPRAHLIAAAESYAHIDAFGDACYRFYFERSVLARNALKRLAKIKLQKHLTAIPAKYQEAVITTALTELRYPARSGDGLAFSERERAATAGISRQTWRKHGMNDVCTAIIYHIISAAHTAERKIRQQLYDLQMNEESV